jgi:hypothetical protein
MDENIAVKKSLKIPDNQKRQIDERTMAIRKRTKEQTIIYKTIHRKLKIEQHEPH